MRRNDFELMISRLWRLLSSRSTSRVRTVSASPSVNPAASSATAMRSSACRGHLSELLVQFVHLPREVLYVICEPLALLLLTDELRVERVSVVVLDPPWLCSEVAAR